MDVGSPIRQPGPSSLPGLSQTAPQQGPVVTELPKPKSVDAAVKVESPKLDFSGAMKNAIAPAVIAERRKQFVIDDRTKDMIVRTLDVESGAVVAQFPDDWQLKQRAYSRAMIEKQLAQQAEVDRLGSFAEPVERNA
jgi:hypothetical protein